MIGEDIKTEVSLEELRKITWDYSKIVIIGLYRGEVIRGFLWEAKECGDVNPLLITRCNVVEGWIEYLVVEHPEAIDNMTVLFNTVKRDENGDPLRAGLLCKVVVDLHDTKGKVILTLR